MRPSLLGLALPALASLTSASPAPPRGNKGLAPIWTPPAPPSKDGSVGIQAGGGDGQSHIVKDSYIVVFKDGVQEHQVVQHKQGVHEMHTRESERLQIAVKQAEQRAMDERLAEIRYVSSLTIILDLSLTT